MSGQTCSRIRQNLARVACSRIRQNLAALLVAEFATGCRLFRLGRAIVAVSPLPPRIEYAGVWEFQFVVRGLRATSWKGRAELPRR